MHGTSFPRHPQESPCLHFVQRRMISHEYRLERKSLFCHAKYTFNNNLQFPCHIVSKILIPCWFCPIQAIGSCCGLEYSSAALGQRQQESIKCPPSRNRASGHGSTKRIVYKRAPVKVTVKGPKSLAATVRTAHRLPPSADAGSSGKNMRRSLDQNRSEPLPSNLKKRVEAIV